MVQAQHVAQQLSGSEQSQQPSASDQSDPGKHRLKRDLSKLIHKYEKRQSRWGSPRRAASIQHLLPLDYGCAHFLVLCVPKHTKCDFDACTSVSRCAW